MALYFVRTTQTTSVAYVIDSSNELTKQSVQEILNGTHSLADFDMKYACEIVEDCLPILVEEYIEIFNEHYPQFKDIDIAQKLFNITKLETNDDLIETEPVEDRDQL